MSKTEFPANDIDGLIPSEFDQYLFHEGTLNKGYNLFGAHKTIYNDEEGVCFTVWAPNALEVAVVGDFNNWYGGNHRMKRIASSGIWILFVPGLMEGELYKYEILTPSRDKILKADPYAFQAEVRPNTASIVHRLDTYSWQDEKWQRQKKHVDHFGQPMLIYEVHAGSWKTKANGELYSYRELADELIPYIVSLGYTHLQFMPLMEHPFDRSWGYQITGFYAVTSRFGTPNDFKYLVDQCHRQGIGVILDWVPLHFCKDAHGLGRFDGTALYEPIIPEQAERPNWGTYNFDFHKPEVVSFLLSNAMFWLDIYHIDGFRVDAVSSMIYLNHDNHLDTVLTNENGGDENLAAIRFIKRLNEVLFEAHPNVLMIAEEATDYPLVSAPTYLGGLGFNYKWNMGWANDVLKYMEMDIRDRPKNHHLLTFSFFYAFSENFILPFSHDELVYGKRSLLNKMPGDYWQKFANLRVLLGYLFTHPGKKLLFMGQEFAQFDEWKDIEELDWKLFDFPAHQQFYTYFKELVQVYHQTRSLFRLDHDESGFEWIDPHNAENSVISFIRRGKRRGDYCIIVCNFSANVYKDYQIGVPVKGDFEEIFNSDLAMFGGSGVQNRTPIHVLNEPHHNQLYSMNITIPPLAVTIYKKKKQQRPKHKRHKPAKKK